MTLRPPLFGCIIKAIYLPEGALFMWTRPLLKENAKNALRGRYWPTFAVALICSVLNSGQRVHTVYQRTVEYGRGHHYTYTTSTPLWGSLGIVGILLAVFFVAVLMVGQARFFMENRQGAAPISSIFSTFHRDGYWNLVKIKFLKGLYIFLWSLLLVVPGIIKAYQYSMVDYIAAENPYLPASRVFELSRAMTDGEKWEIFVLDLSFLGWYFLGALALGMGVFFVIPYYQATYAELYAALHAKALAQGISDEQELSGFVRY